MPVITLDELRAFERFAPYSNEDLTLLLTFCVVVGGWSFLSVLGNERQRRVQERELTRLAAEAEAAVGRQVAR